MKTNIQFSRTDQTILALVIGFFAFAGFTAGTLLGLRRPIEVADVLSGLFVTCLIGVAVVGIWYGSRKQQGRGGQAENQQH